MRRLAAILCLTLLLALPTRTWAAPSPADVNLRVSDLPHGFHIYSSITVTGARLIASGGSHAFHMQLRDLTLAQLAAFVDATAHGIRFIESDMLQYKSAAAAHADYELAASAPVVAPVQRLVIARVGSEYLARTLVVAGSKERERFDDILFCRGRYIYLMRATGLNGTFTPAQAVAIARIVDARVQRAH